jgi:hypothetical protein
MIVFVVIHHFLLSHENIIVVLVVKHFVQHVHPNKYLYRNSVLKMKFEFVLHVMIELKRKIIYINIPMKIFFVFLCKEPVVFVLKLYQIINHPKKVKLNLMKKMLFN